jgi:toxin ParE1/3/4
MDYRVELTTAAERDLERIIGYIAEHDLPERALHVFEAIEARIDALQTAPSQGTYPHELAALGIRDFREVFFKPYRIIYPHLGIC